MYISDYKMEVTCHIHNIIFMFKKFYLEKYKKYLSQSVQNILNILIFHFSFSQEPKKIDLNTVANENKIATKYCYLIVYPMYFNDNEILYP